MFFKKNNLKRIKFFDKIETSNFDIFIVNTLDEGTKIIIINPKNSKNIEIKNKIDIIKNLLNEKL